MNYEELMQKLNEEKSSRPIIAKLWMNYLKIKRDNYRNTLINADLAIKSFETIPDLTTEQIITLFILSEEILKNS